MLPRPQRLTGTRFASPSSAAFGGTFSHKGRRLLPPASPAKNRLSPDTAPHMADKKNRLEPRLPRGFADRGPAGYPRRRGDDGRRSRRSTSATASSRSRRRFVEYTEALGKFLPDQDRPNEGVFSFQDEDEAWLSLRYDLTAPLARYVAQNYEALPKPYRSYRAGWVFRNEKPGPGRFRQFMQFDADTVGASSPAADAEICMMAADAMEALGFERGQYVIKVNSRKVLDGVMEAIGVSERDSRAPCGAARDRQAGPLGRGGRSPAPRRRAQGRERRFYEGRRLTASANSAIVGFVSRVRFAQSLDLSNRIDAKVSPKSCDRILKRDGSAGRDQRVKAQLTERARSEGPIK